MSTLSSSAAPVLVTGASGFVGRRIIQQLTKQGRRVKALVRRIPEQPLDPTVELVIGDLGRPDSYSPALDGVSAVVHAGLTHNLSHEPQVTSGLLSFCARAGVRKFVHLSSIVVYGNPPVSMVTEETPLLPSADLYSRSKLAIEEALQAASTGLEITVLRLGCVYGPGGGWWTDGLLHQMRHGKLILVNQGTGIANLIHVSDVAQAVALALQRSGSLFDVFNVTDGMPVAWSRYYAELEQLAGQKATVSMSAAQAREHAGKWLRPSLARRIIRKITGAPFVYTLDERGIQNQASKAVYSNAKAAAILGFVPQYNLESGMKTVHSMLPSPPASLLVTP